MQMVNILDKECLLIPYPHKEMGSFLEDKNDDYFQNIKYSYSHRNLENNITDTMLNFHTEYGYPRCVYNVYLEGRFVIHDCNTFNLSEYLKKPNPNFKYLIAIPI
jgi:hypothetical protein